MATSIGTAARVGLTIDDRAKGVDASGFVDSAPPARGPVSVSTGGNAATLQTARDSR